MMTKAHLFVFSLFFLIIFNLLLSLLLNTSYSYSFSKFNASNQSYGIKYNSTIYNYNSSTTTKTYKIQILFGSITLPDWLTPIINGLVFIEKLLSFGLVPLTPYASVNFIISLINIIVIILLIYSLLPFE
jgi:hypothetical protein